MVNLHGPVILESVVGSKAYGLDTPESDTDTMGVFVAPTLKVSGWDWGASEETWSDSGPEGDDSTYHEVGKFLRLAVKANPTLIELLFMREELYTVLSPVGAEMIALREHVLSEASVRGAYYGYVREQIDRYANRPNPKEKMARHSLRLARQGIQLLTTGTMDVRVPDPEEYFALANMDTYPKVALLLRELDKLGMCESVLPKEPNRDRIHSFLMGIRASH